ncbi:MAG TPA: GAF domain-containing protein [Bacteroidales bacterium]|nr:GAF domain-containing protein [Bacteroidales bacterium]
MKLILIKNSLLLPSITISVILLLLIILFSVLFVNRKKNKLIREQSNHAKELDKKLEALNEKMVMQKQEIRIREREEKEFNWYMSGLAKFSDLMSRHKNNIETLSGKLISTLVKYLDAQQGGIFLLNDEDPSNIFLELTATYAFSSEQLDKKRIEIGEGLPGTCFKDGEILHIKDLPPAYTIIKSGLGEETPKELLLTPLRMDEIVIGVIELAFFKKIKPNKIEFLTKLAENITSVISTTRAQDKAEKVISRMNDQTKKMSETEETMRRNIEELESAQEEASLREDELITLAEESASREEQLQYEVEELKLQLKETQEKEVQTSEALKKISQTKNK